jgi:hypothetical protein
MYYPEYKIHCFCFEKTFPQLSLSCIYLSLSLFFSVSSSRYAARCCLEIVQITVFPVPCDSDLILRNLYCYYCESLRKAFLLLTWALRLCRVDVNKPLSSVLAVHMFIFSSVHERELLPVWHTVCACCIDTCVTRKICYCKLLQLCCETLFKLMHTEERLTICIN